MDQNPLQGTVPVDHDPPPPPPTMPPYPSGEPIPVVSQPEPEKDLYAWKAPSRPFKKRNREFYTTIATLVILLSVILLFAKEFLLIGVILSFGFVSYVLATVPPGSVNHRLTNKGLRTGEKLYLWMTLGRYWWDKKWHEDLLMVENPTQFPGRLTLILGVGDKDKIDSLVKKYLVNQKPEPTWFDNAAKWLQEKVPLESDNTPKAPKA